jgi:serpin B
MKKLSLIVLLISFLSITMISCSSDEPVEEEVVNIYSDRTLPTVLDDDAKALMANNELDFSLTLLKIANESGLDTQNVCIPSYSAFVTLSMLSNGDNGMARISMLNAMGFNSDLNLNLLNDYNSNVLKVITTIDGYPSVSVNKISFWYEGTSKINEDFWTTLRSAYQVEFTGQTPSGDDGKNAINEWANSNFHMYKVNKDYLIEVTKDNATIVNALLPVYFWKPGFANDKYASVNFQNMNGSETTVNAMTFYTGANINYSATDDAEILELPTRNNNVSMYVISPYADVKFSSYLSSLTSEKLQSLINLLQANRILLQMPSCNIHTQYNLLELCMKKGKSLSCGNISSDGSDVVFTNLPIVADFTIGKDGIYNTKDNYTISGDVIETKFDNIVTINRPFIFLVKEKSSNLLIYVGVVKNI